MDFLVKFAEFWVTMFAIDFVSGLVHWFEDTFGTEDTPIYGKWIVRPNVVHHEQPAAFTKKTWLESSWDLTLSSGLIVFAAWRTGHLSWHVWLFAFLGANANQLHKYAHLPKEKTPAPVRLFQFLRILQRPGHHALHHSGEKNSSYCVITPYLNPLLDRLHFWRFLEKLTVPLLGAPRREDLKKR
ncbi:MAG: hypothetical protein RL213_1082 [Bacteroidota bacterium]|jgi:ubiquitin-conjugating enzyme E2 variant